LIPTAIHTMEDITETITAFSAVRERLVSGEYMAIGQTMVQG